MKQLPQISTAGAGQTALCTLRRRHLLAAMLGVTALLPGIATAQSGTAKHATTVLVVGDSISAEYGLPRGSGWVPLLQKKLDAEQPGWKVANSSISGDTTAGGRARLPQALQAHRPKIVILELGANDAMRGLPLAQTRDNLTAMTRMAHKTGAKVLLLGMQVPPNYGADYTRQFGQVFADVAKAEKAALVPFLLKGVADAPDSLQWFQTDRIHPNVKAQPRLLENVWGQLQRILQ